MSLLSVSVRPKKVNWRRLIGRTSLSTQLPSYTRRQSRCKQLIRHAQGAVHTHRERSQAATEEASGCLRRDSGPADSISSERSAGTDSTGLAACRRCHSFTSWCSSGLAGGDWARLEDTGCRNGLYKSWLTVETWLLSSIEEQHGFIEGRIAGGIGKRKGEKKV